MREAPATPAPLCFTGRMLCGARRPHLSGKRACMIGTSLARFRSVGSRHVHFSARPDGSSPDVLHALEPGLEVGVTLRPTYRGSGGRTHDSEDATSQTLKGRVHNARRRPFVLKSRTLGATALLGLMSLDACVTPAERTHHYGCRGEPMRDSATAKMDTARRAPENGVHHMPSPRGSTMSDAVHLGCNPPDPTTTQRASN